MVGIDALWSVALVWMVVEHHAVRRRDSPSASAWARRDSRLTIGVAWTFADCPVTRQTVDPVRLAISLCHIS